MLNRPAFEEAVKNYNEAWTRLQSYIDTPSVHDSDVFQRSFQSLAASLTYAQSGLAHVAQHDFGLNWEGGVPPNYKPLDYLKIRDEGARNQYRQLVGQREVQRPQIEAFRRTLDERLLVARMAALRIAAPVSGP
jgi:hypothetical protein